MGSTDNGLAWVTLATTDAYAVGALVLAHSLKAVNTRHKLHVLYTDGVSDEMTAQLCQVFDDHTKVNVLDSADAENLALINRPDLGVTFTKLHCWRLTQYSKCVFLDADTFVVKNCDELFERPEFSAAPDVGWPDIFNTGVFVFVPSEQTYRNLLDFALVYGSFDGGDQGLLNAYFSTWRESDATHRLPFTYNVTTVAIYGYAAALKRFAPNIKIIHFLGKQKPWALLYGDGVAGMAFVSDYHKQWYQLYANIVQQLLPPSSSVISSSTPSSLPSSSFSIIQHPLTSFENRPIVSHGATAIPGRAPAGGGYEAWEAGSPDYLGADSFANIQKAIEKALKGE
ncbi:hypothetical protein niasHS_001554 [Heterodera schachtii]|uniref:glycogenin glucosyltransferase n=1 Tax=Heterodera schachtii TaxID=97005 RepID=A0ABD2KF20_HETSC